MLGVTAAFAVATLILGFFTDWNRSDHDEEEESAGLAFDLAFNPGTEIR